MKIDVIRKQIEVLRRDHQSGVVCSDTIKAPMTMTTSELKSMISRLPSPLYSTESTKIRGAHFVSLDGKQERDIGVPSAVSTEIRAVPTGSLDGNEMIDTVAAGTVSDDDSASAALLEAAFADHDYYAALKEQAVVGFSDRPRKDELEAGIEALEQRLDEKRAALASVRED